MKRLLFIALMLLTLSMSTVVKAQQEKFTYYLLPTKDEGPWECKYYFLNYNDDIAIADEGQWYAEDADETEWMSGVGPFSNSDDQFLVTRWPSGVRPILVRRHFTLNEQFVAAIADGVVRLHCSYDENPRVWLNGTLIWEKTGWNDNSYFKQRLSKDFRQLMHVGDNVLAVSLQQGQGGGHIDYGLELETTTDLTGIKDIYNGESNGNEKAEVYDLQGRRLSTANSQLTSLRKGVYIVNGKKYVVGK